MQIAILDDYQRLALTMADWSKLADCDVRVSERHLPPGTELERFLAGADVVVAMRERTRFTAATLEKLPHLRLLVTTGASNSAIDIMAARQLGITVCGTPGGGIATAELAFGLVLALMRHIPTEVAGLRAGAKEWQLTLGKELGERSLGIVGFGRLGQAMARFGRAFGMEVRAWSRSLDAKTAAEAGVLHVPDLHDLLGMSEVLSLHLPLTAETRSLLGAAELALMPPGAVLINTARAGLVDERALIDALSTGQLAGAGLDVHSTEPLPPEHPFRSLPNVIATPHLGYVTEETYRRYFPGVVEAITSWREGHPVRVICP